MQTFEIELDPNDLDLLSTPNTENNKELQESILSMLAEIALAAIPELALNPPKFSE